jgi:hypothetical protein
MVTSQDHDQCVKAQADRVVAAYRDLRAASHNTDFASDEFPVGRLAELFQQVKQLDVWLEAPHAEQSEQSVREYVESELENVRAIISEIDHLATDGEASSDPAASLAAIKRLAREAHSTMYGKL